MLKLGNRATSSLFLSLSLHLAADSEGHLKASLGPGKKLARSKHAEPGKHPGPCSGTPCRPQCGKQSLLKKDESERKMSRNGSGQGRREDLVGEQGIQPQAFIH